MPSLKHLKDAFSAAGVRVQNLSREPDVILPLKMAKTYHIKGGGSSDRKIDITAAEAVILWTRLSSKLRKTLADELVDEILYWDENNNLLYVEAIAYFEDTAKFVKFRNEITTELNIKGFNCPVCNSKAWTAHGVDVKTVEDRTGKRWKCFSIIFICRICWEEGRITSRQIRMMAFKYAFSKVAKGIKDFVERIRKVVISGDLARIC